MVWSFTNGHIYQWQTMPLNGPRFLLRFSRRLIALESNNFPENSDEC